MAGPHARLLEDCRASRAIAEGAGFRLGAILLQALGPDVNPHPTHDLTPLDEPGYAYEHAPAGWPTVRAAWFFGSRER